MLAYGGDRAVFFRKKIQERFSSDSILAFGVKKLTGAGIIRTFASVKTARKVSIARRRLVGRPPVRSMDERGREKIF